MSSMDGIIGAAMDDMAARSRKRIYKRDPEAWMADVLGKRLYSKQQEMLHSYLNNARTAAKSSNGVGKSDLVAGTITWEAATADPLDDLCIVSAPTLSQIEKVIFAYMKANKGTAKLRGIDLPGRITETLAWKVDDVAGIEGSGLLVFGKRPSDKDIISSFQGTRKRRTKVFLDEAGGLPTDMFDAAEAVLTGAESKLFAIGNPDRRGTYFHRIFTDPRIMPEWSLHTINSFDLPSFTGELVYSDPDKQAAFVAALTSREWVENKQRTWGVDSARYKSKVLGEFPEEGDNSFFSQLAIDKAYDVAIEEDANVKPIIGVDVARFGSDENRMMVNRGGLIREYTDGTEDGGAWSKTDLITTARKIHRAANRIGAWLVNVDANGVGGGVIDALTTLDEFSDATYEIGAIYGSNSSPDSHRWFNARAYQYDHLRTLMMEGKVDLDYEDEQLRDELISQTYKFNNKGAIQITSKDDMRSAGLKSPDTLDAVVLSVIDFQEEDAEKDMKPGAVVQYSDVFADKEHAFYSNSFW
jgi:hypothetical protein